MIKVLKEDSNDWLLNIKNIKIDYVYKFIENYIEDKFNIKINITSDSTQFDLDDSAMFGSIQGIIDRDKSYKTVKIISETDTYFNKEYSSVDCKYNHNILLVGDFEKFEYLLTIIIDDSLSNIPSDQELINLYNEDDEILLSLISDKKG